jgi:intracellular sulfur oxidation DsrE/DsrF family protein
VNKALFCLLLVLGFSTPGFADDGAISNAVVVQANGNKADLNRALVLASNMHEVLAKAKFEVIVYGPNVHLITSFSDVVPLIQKVQGEGIKVIACGRSLTSEHVSESDLAPGITVVPFGAVHIVNREKQGWQYIKP